LTPAGDDAILLAREIPNDLGAERHGMKYIVIAFPFFTDHTVRVLDRCLSLPDVKVGIITHTPVDNLIEPYRPRIAGHWQVSELREPDQILWAVRGLAERHGPVFQLFSSQEHVQEAIAEAREVLGIPGMPSKVVRNFRDKALMKQLLRDAGLPCARYRRALGPDDAWAFATEVGFPMVVKPIEGAASQTTFKVASPQQLHDALWALNPRPGAEIILEEFVTGEEHSLDTFSLNGQHRFHTITNYYPSCLEVMRNPWMQWTVVLPREVEVPEHEDIRIAGWKALDALGMEMGMSHLEWFRRPDGSCCISEVGARPPGAQFTTLISRANDWDALGAWARLLVYGELDRPERKYASGAAYLRGQGNGPNVTAVHGWERVRREIGHLITDVKIPPSGIAKGLTYEGEGYIIVRHPETKVVEEALRWAVGEIRVELG